MIKTKIHTFKDLEAWKQAHELVITVYKTLESFPAYEKFSLCDQMRRCSVSISSNIAEGFTRATRKEKMRFYNIALGSSVELQDQLFIALDLKYIPEETFIPIDQQNNFVQRLIYGLIRSSKNK